MTKRLLFLVATLLLFITRSVDGRTFGASVTGAQEVPPVETRANGEATFTLSRDHMQLHADLQFFSLNTAVTGAHLHGKAARGTNASILINFTPDLVLTPGEGSLNETYTIARELGDDLAKDPSLFYVNVHSSAHPGGEIRGQLTASIDSETRLAGALRGSSEVPPNTSTVVGAFLLTLDANDNLTCEINAGSLANITVAHIHRGAAGVVGGIVIDLTRSASFSNGRLRGTLPVSDSSLAAEIRANPANFYVNVHTSAFPGGEIRGQLAVANEYDFAGAGRVVGASALFVTDLRIFNPSHETAAVSLLEYFPAGTSDSSASATMVATIPRRGTAILDDVIGPNVLNRSGTAGALRVSSASNLIVTSRVFADLRSSTGGTVGHVVPGLKRADALRDGLMAHLSHTPGVVPGSRMNIGFFNPNSVEVDVRLRLRDAAGVAIGTKIFILPPLSQQQNALDAYFPGITTQTNITLSFESSAAIFAYASVIDNATSDQTYIFALQDEQ